MKNSQYKVWGSDIESEALGQMDAAMSLPVSVAGALMPDAHVGYGLPIGGVLATENAVIPYGVGVDIACRMMMTVFRVPPSLLQTQRELFKKALETQTKFGVGSRWQQRKQHDVMDEDWNITPITAQLKDKAHNQLGTSGSGNHFVEFGEAAIEENSSNIPTGVYLSVLSHSGSRGSGATVADHYTRLAKEQHPELSGQTKNLAWLDMNDDGLEYWAAMELMGKYASANHHVIHRSIIDFLEYEVVYQIENHHNFAWRERHHGRDVIVHRKGATPAGKGVLGIIPGSMAAPGYLVEGLGNEDSLTSTSHGAGRRMSRKAAKKEFTWKETNAYLKKKGVELLSAGLDEVPWVYKNINDVMNAQQDLAKIIGRFTPRIVKMAPAGERPED